MYNIYIICFGKISYGWNGGSGWWNGGIGGMHMVFKLYFIDWWRQKLKNKIKWIGFENFGIRKNNGL